MPSRPQASPPTAVSEAEERTRKSPAKCRFSLLSQHIKESEMTPGKMRDQRGLCLRLPTSFPHILGPVTLRLRNSPGHSFLASRHSTSYRKHPQPHPPEGLCSSMDFCSMAVSPYLRAALDLWEVSFGRFNSNSSSPLLSTFSDSAQKNLLCADPFPTLRDQSCLFPLVDTQCILLLCLYDCS